MAVTQAGTRSSGSPDGDSYRWFMALSAAVAGDGPTMAMQPIVDTATGGVTGYEALARFAPDMEAGPDQWFAMADRLGFGPALESASIRASLARRGDLPSGCWLSINVDPRRLAHPEVRSALDTDLDGVVIELTEHGAVDDWASVIDSLAPVRRRGARLAIDDVGAGYAGLQWLLALRPDVVKADRLLVAGLDEDRVRCDVVAMLASVSDALDAWLVAEGVETEGELDALVRLGIPLAQGYLFGHPDPTVWSEPPEGLQRHLSGRPRPAGRSIGGLVQQCVTYLDDVTGAARPVPVAPGVGPEGHGAGVEAAASAAAGPQVVDGSGGSGRHGRSGRGRALIVGEGEDIQVVARWAMARDPELRWDPVVCVDAEGRVRGLVPVEVVVQALIDVVAPPSPGAAPEPGWGALRAV